MHFITFLSQLSIKLMFSAILLSFGRGSDWDQLLYAVTELPASFLRPVPALILYVWVHANVQPPLPSTYMLHVVALDIYLHISGYSSLWGVLCGCVFLVTLTASTTHKVEPPAEDSIKHIKHIWTRKYSSEELPNGGWNIHSGKS